MSKNSFRFVPFPVSLEAYFFKSTDTEKALIYYFLKSFHFNNFAKCIGSFSISQIAEDIDRNRNAVGKSLKVLENDGLILCQVDNKNKKIKISFNRKYLNEPLECVQQNVADTCNKSLHDVQGKVAESATKDSSVCKESLHDVQQKLADNMPETIEKTSISEEPNNSFKNIYNNNINNSFNKQKTPDGFIDKNENETLENPPNLFDELFNIKALSPEEKRAKEAKAIFNKLKAIGYMRQPDRPEEYNDALINKRVSQVDNLEILSQMIEAAMRDYSLTTNEERCKRININLKYPENFHFLASNENDDAFERRQKRLKFLSPIKKLFKIVSGNPDDVISEFIDAIMPLCIDFNKGYIRASDELVINTIRSREEFFKKMNRPFLAEDKAKVREMIENEFEDQRQRFELIGYTLKKSYSVSDLKSLINFALYSNKHRQKVKNFIDADLEKATFRILKAVTGAAENFSPETQDPEPAPKEKIMTFEEVRHKKSFNKNTLPAFIPHIENNEGLADYVAENLKKGL